MNSSEVKSILKQIQFENRRQELREEFEKFGIRFKDKHGWGYIRDGQKHYDQSNF